MIATKPSKSDYKPTRHDQMVMSVCMKAGYKVFADFDKQQSWVRHNPLIILVGVYRNKRYNLIRKSFDQKYLTYYTFLFYHKFYNKHILNKIKVKQAVVVKKMTFPPPPPAKELLPPPPPS
jgi:hypothetical protein